MFITKSKHNKIVAEKVAIIKEEFEKNAKLEIEIREAKDLKTILEKLYPVYFMGNDTITFNSASGGYELNLPDKVPVYVDDYFGGKVIKQEATKVIHITKEGEVKTGLTKKPADKNYTYLLKRD